MQAFSLTGDNAAGIRFKQKNKNMKEEGSKAKDDDLATILADDNISFVGEEAPEIPQKERADADN